MPRKVQVAVRVCMRATPYTQILISQGWEAIRNDRFSLTPKPLYDELVRSTEQIISSWGSDYQRRQARMKAPLREDAEGKAEAEKQVPNIAQTWRRKDKYGLARASALFSSSVYGGRAVANACYGAFLCTYAIAEEVDKDFRRTFTKRFRGWEDAVKAASEVLIDETTL